MHTLTDYKDIILQHTEKFSARLNLNVECIFELEHLLEKLDNGLTSLYQEVFHEEPYNEDFTIHDVNYIFIETLKASGGIFTVSSYENKEIIAFFAFMPLCVKQDIADMVNHLIDTSKVSYYSEGAVAKQWRRKGISTAINELTLIVNSLLKYEHLLARTSIYNYKQISSFVKLGMSRFFDFIQEVIGKRKNKITSTDLRSFYSYNLEHIKIIQKPKKLLRVTIVRPGGNDTALVWDQVPREQQKDLSLQIQTYYPGIEQVMFIEKNPHTGNYRGQMPGNEFCGNAIRSLGYVLLNKCDGEITLETSGTLNLIKVNVNNGNSAIEISMLETICSVQKIPTIGEHLVKLADSIFLMVSINNDYAKRILAIPFSKRKKIILRMLEKMHLLEEALSGVIFFEVKSNTEIGIYPHIYVRDTGTLYYETACGSGSIAATMIMAESLHDGIFQQSVLQPSGAIICTSIERNEGKTIKASINGDIQILFDDKLALP